MTRDLVREASADAARGEAADLVAEGLVTVQVAARFLSVSRSKLYEMMNLGELQYVKLGRARRVPRRALVDLAASRLRGGWRQ